MKGIRIIIAFLFLTVSCASCATPTNFIAVGASLTELDGKVASHYYTSGIPDHFDAAQYKNTIDEVCKNNPRCLEKADKIFADYDVKARKVNSIFTIMLCDKKTGNKIMEAFSCNDLKVAVRSWEKQPSDASEFIDNWKEIYEKECR